MSKNVLIVVSYCCKNKEYEEMKTTVKNVMFPNEDVLFSKITFSQSSFIKIEYYDILIFDKPLTVLESVQMDYLRCKYPSYKFETIKEMENRMTMKNETNKNKFSNKTIMDLKESMNDVVLNLVMLDLINDEFNENSVAKFYLDKAKQINKENGIEPESSFEIPYVKAIHLMTEEITSFKNLLTLYIKELQNNKKELEDYNKFMKLYNEMKNIFDKDGE